MPPSLKKQVLEKLAMLKAAYDDELLYPMLDSADPEERSDEVSALILQVRRTQSLTSIIKDTAEQASSRTWQCENDECQGKDEAIVSWSYDNLAHNGGPVCPLCDDDMSLIEK